MPAERLSVCATVKSDCNCKLAIEVLMVPIVPLPEKVIRDPACSTSVPTLMVPAPDKVPRLPIVNEVLALEAKVPATSIDARRPVALTLLSMVTVTPDGIMTASAVRLNDGVIPPTQVAELLQLPEVVAVKVKPKADIEEHAITISNRLALIFLIDRTFGFI